MATSKAQYHKESLAQVLLACGLKPGRAWETNDTLRALIDAKPDSVELLAGVADFWLDLDKKTGPARRKAPDPPSPFRKRGQKWVATKGKVAEWDLAWRMKAVAQILTQSKSPRGRSMAEAFLLERMPMAMWCGGIEPQMLGPAVMLPSDVERLAVEALDVVWLRPDQALRRRWLDPQDAHDFLLLFRAAQKLHADELEEIQRALNTPQSIGTRDRGGRL
ncbi:hypothetical protein [Lysobacter capsici]|uniref:hypothetical protein n=1 Tax=Lysobacter capsici TaxID=435897 RepID=UPI000BBA7048|nr:hypothetical protein [Lysobacter capsici]ATE70766.1 hypothetical protein CNO08_04950 [Lysobacter capsici]